MVSTQTCWALDQWGSDHGLNVISHLFADKWRWGQYSVGSPWSSKGWRAKTYSYNFHLLHKERQEYRKLICHVRAACCHYISEQAESNCLKVREEHVHWEVPRPPTQLLISYCAISARGTGTNNRMHKHVHRRLLRQLWVYVYTCSKKYCLSFQFELI